MRASQNFQEQERKETHSRLKRSFSFPFFLFLSFLNGSFFSFLSLLGLVILFLPFFSIFPYFHLSKTVLGFLMGLNLATLERVLHGNLSKPVLCHSTKSSLSFLKPFLIFLQPVFLSNKEKREPKTASVLKGFTLASVQ